MSPPASNEGPIGSATKPKSNIYTVLLAISLVLILLSILLLWLEMGTYEYKKDARRGPFVGTTSSVALASNMSPADHFSTTA